MFWINKAVQDGAGGGNKTPMTHQSSSAVSGGLSPLFSLKLDVSQMFFFPDETSIFLVRSFPPINFSDAPGLCRYLVLTHTNCV